MQNLIKRIIKMCFIFALVCSACLLLKTTVCMLPDNIIRNNMEKSAEIINARGSWPSLPVFTSDSGNKIDMFTEYLYLNILYNNDSSKPINSAIMNFYITDDELTKNPALELYRCLTDTLEKEIIIEKTPYWCGAITVIRPLMLILSYEQCQELLSILFWVLLLIVVCGVAKENSIFTAAFAFSIIVVKPMVIPLTFHTGLVWIITFCSMLIIRNVKFKDVETVMMVVGMLVAFYDWQSTPIISYVFPMMILILNSYKINYLKGYKDGLICLIKTSLAWASGYGGMIVMKWVITSLYLGKNQFYEAMHRLSFDTVVENTTVLEVLNKIVSQIDLLNIFDKYFLYVFFIIICLILVIRKRCIKVKPDTLFIMLISLAPIAWLFVFTNHINKHYFFTYRILTCTLCGGLYFFVDIMNIGSKKIE